MAGFKSLCAIGFGFADFIRTGTPEEIAEIETIRTRVNGGGPISPGTVRRIKTLTGHYHLLVAAEMWCPDCRVNLPAIDLLCRHQPQIGLTIVSQARAEREMMGLLGLNEILVPVAAILDQDFRLLGRFVERPSFVVERGLDSEGSGYRNGNYTDSTITDILAVLEAAAAAAHPVPQVES